MTACNSLRWRFCTRPGGVSLLDFTALSNVGPVGLFRIIFSTSDSADNGTSKPHFWAGQRYAYSASNFVNIRLLFLFFKLGLGVKYERRYCVYENHRNRLPGPGYSDKYDAVDIQLRSHLLRIMFRGIRIQTNHSPRRKHPEGRASLNLTPTVAIIRRGDWKMRLSTPHPKKLLNRHRKGSIPYIKKL